MKTFPMFLQMQGRRVVIAGGDEQAAQKCRLILKTEAQIIILAPVLNMELLDLVDNGRIEWQNKPITPSSFDDAALVFIATGCPATDACLHMMAKDAGAVVNVVDQPHLCDALTPSIVDRDPVVVAIGTEGNAPVLARQIKSRLEESLEPHLGDLAALAGRLRNQAASRLGPRQRRDLWRWVFKGPVRQAYAKGAEREAAKMLKHAIETGNFETQDGGSVAFVDAGPGPADLITLRAIQRLQDADVILFEDEIDKSILEFSRRDAERVLIDTEFGERGTQSRCASNSLVALANEGKRVVRLNCGNKHSGRDQITEIHALIAAEIQFEIVPKAASTNRTFPTVEQLQAPGVVRIA